MTAPYIHCDEDINSAVWHGLRRLGVRASAVAEERQFALRDDAVLLWASAIGRAVLTHNSHDFPRIHREVLMRSEHHAGIIVASRALPLGEIIRRVARLCAELSAEDMRDRLEYLGSW